MKSKMENAVKNRFDRQRTTIACKGGKTEQSHKTECNINTIVKKMRSNAYVRLNPKAPVYGDCTNAVDYQTALDKVQAAQGAFMTLPAEVRSRFANNPLNLFAFLDDDKNRDEAIKLGLVDRPEPKPEEPAKEPAQTPPAA